MAEKEFFGNLDVKPDIKIDQHSRYELIDWVVANPKQTKDWYREIEDGDFLQVFDGMGRLQLNKKIIRDYDTLYNRRYGRQMYQGKSLAWIPRGVDIGFWDNLFRNHYRARIVKNVEEE